MDMDMDMDMDMELNKINHLKLIFNYDMSSIFKKIYNFLFDKKILIESIKIVIMITTLIFLISSILN